MKIDVVLYPQLGLVPSFSDKAVVVLDILRATSTIVTALANNALAVIPVVEPTEVIELVRGIGAEQCVAGGERKGFKIEGFALGNSPLEYTKESISGKKVILCTTNGTKAIKWAQNASELIVGSYLNAEAVAQYLLQSEKDVVIICSGREMNLGMEDLACAGWLIRQLLTQGRIRLTDSARLAVLTSEQADIKGVSQFISETDHGRYLKEIGMEADLKACAELDLYPILPRYKNGMIVTGER